MYTLVYGEPSVLHVHDLSGQFVTKWDHNVGVGYSCTFDIVADQVIIPHRKNQLLIVYSLGGSVVENISCPQLSQLWACLCLLGDDSVVVSDYCSSQVFRVDITAGQVMWTCSNVPKPGGVTSYRQMYILVASGDNNAIKILDVLTG